MQTKNKISETDMANNQERWKVIESIRNESILFENEKRKQQNVELALNLVPFRFKNKNFNDFVIENNAQGEIKEIIKSYFDTFEDRLAEGSSLIFIGVPGTGKTFLSLILYQELARLSYRVEYQPSLNFLRLLQEKQFDSYQSLNVMLDYYRELPFLVIDEVSEGCGKAASLADWERHLLRMLIDVRYQNNRSTLIISNRGKNELTNRLGEPTIDRLLERGLILAFNWDSYRRK